MEEKKSACRILVGVSGNVVLEKNGEDHLDRSCEK